MEYHGRFLTTQLRIAHGLLAHGFRQTSKTYCWNE